MPVYLTVQPPIAQRAESHRYLGDTPANFATDPKVEAEFLDFAYDPIGNRTSHTAGSATPVTSGYSANALNQYRTITSELPELAPLLFYDDDGNLTGTADMIPADMNCDGMVDFADLDPFVLALSGCGGYDAAYPDCDCLNADINGDGQVTFADLDLFASQMGENGFRQVFTQCDDVTLEPVIVPGAECAVSIDVDTLVAVEDDCDAAPAIECVRSDGLSCAEPFPCGATVVTVTATDQSGNSANCELTVTIDAVTEIALTVELAGLDDVERCVTFELHRCDTQSSDCEQADPLIVDELLTFTGGVAGSVLVVPCGQYECVLAYDPLHTLKRKISPTGSAMWRSLRRPTGRNCSPVI